MVKVWKKKAVLLCGQQCDSVGRLCAGLGAHNLKRQRRSMSTWAQGDGSDWECVKIFSRNRVLKDGDHLPLKQEVGV